MQLTDGRIKKTGQPYHKAIQPGIGRLYAQQGSDQRYILLTG